MAPSRTIIIAGAGIGGLTASLALAKRGFRVTLLEQAERLEEAGAGIQLSPNATRLLIDLGLEERLRADCVVPQAVQIHNAAGRTLGQVPLGATGAARYGAPYWALHRADLQAALLDAVRGTPDIALKLGVRAEDYAVHRNGITVACRRGAAAEDESGIALVAADGLWSALRPRIGHAAKPVYQHRTAWRALLPAENVDADFRDGNVHLWLGRDTHLVHYAVKGGRVINIVAIVDDDWTEPGWTAEGAREELLARFSRRLWAESARGLLAMPSRWSKWALCDLPPLKQWGDGPVTLLGDAAHPMLPFLAQGAGMAIEDAAVLAHHLGATPDTPEPALRRYEKARAGRTARAQRAARGNGKTYHLVGAEAVARNLVMRMLGGGLLRRRYDWLYNWRPPSSDRT